MNRMGRGMSVICLILVVIVVALVATGSSGIWLTILAICMALLCPFLMWFGMGHDRGDD